jgi:hypothetical protein
VGNALAAIAAAAFVVYVVASVRRSTQRNASKTRALKSWSGRACTLVVAGHGAITEFAGVLSGVTTEHVYVSVDAQERSFPIAAVMALKQQDGAVVANWSRGPDSPSREPIQTAADFARFDWSWRATKQRYRTAPRQRLRLVWLFLAISLVLAIVLRSTGPGEFFLVLAGLYAVMAVISLIATRGS